MLISMYVKDFILIDQINLDFCEGLSAFTGETGAGKSLLIDAIGILCGDRINTSMIKQGKEKAMIEGVFRIPQNHPARILLAESGYDMDEDTIVIQRTWTHDGKSIARLNYRTTTISLLKKVLSTLVDIHSQHDNQYLLNNKYHLSLLDHYLNAQTLSHEVTERYHVYQSITRELNESLSNDYNEDDLEFLTYQLNEIADADLKEGELETLEEEAKRYMAFEKISSALSQCVSLLNGDQGANPAIYEACRLLENLNEDETLIQSHDKLLELYYALDEQYQLLYDYFDHMEYDEQQVNTINDRIFTIRKIMRKYGGDVKSVMMKHEELERKIDLILHRSDFIRKQEIKQKEAYDAFYEKAKLLHDLRVEKAQELEMAIVKQLRDLQLEHARFHVSFKEIEGNAHGIDAVEFLISMNNGENLKPLQTTASGGELSRLMLGLKTIFTSLQGIETVIFDEIDTGVSGSVAFAIGKKMQQLSRNTQVFCVTHLPQVAACAKHHYLVEKQQNQTSAITQIHELDEPERIRELAMIASDSISPSALSAAQELYQKAQV